MIEPTRRQTLGGLAALAALPASVRAAPPAPASLDALARKGGRRFGSAIAWNPRSMDSGSVQNPAYAALVRRECGLVVPENEMKWQWLRKSPDSFDFSAMDGIVGWAKASGLAVRGHTLLWHRPKWFPGWLNKYDFGANPATEAERLLTTHIRTVTARYGAIIKSWDVVNEAIDHDRNAPIETSLSRAMGSPEAVLDLAFHTAREAAPGAELVYNDYMSWEPAHAKHCADVLRLLEGFRKRGTPVDALGIQSHIEMFSLDPATGVGPYREREWRAFLDEVVGMGYRLLITEFDVKDKALPSDVAVRDAKIADYTRRYFDLMLGYEQLGDILAWGMVDKYSWLQGFAPRDDGREVRACPYDDAYAAKPMRAAIAASFAATG
ncbi:endo-1,4-beta-xylanase [Sphingopyxis indica]|uniref:endo-1,4-beta-xylanase n=1 Tax=Sphingopyxis indica TaxID=436663 RepID=UPI002939108F|nr:endo-1,4-beta-xylanase [Sphingopyxis indica]WOF41991.1 endo-1,4-beta-xylanase [Sphingopyxis indica]